MLGGAGLLLHALPIGQQRLVGQLALEGEAALAAGGDPAGDLRRLDDQGAAAAAGVVEGAALFGRAAPNLAAALGLARGGLNVPGFLA